jgi:hypothetical protein
MESQENEEQHSAMHRSSLIQILLLVLGILSLYQALHYLLAIVLPFLNWIPENRPYEFIFGQGFLLLIDFCINFLLGYLLIWKSASLSKWIIRKSNLQGDFRIISSPISILYFLILILGINGLLKELPVLFDKVFTSFRASINQRAVEISSHPILSKPWTPIFLNVLLPLLLILFAKELASYFSKNFDQTEKIEISDFQGHEST